MQLRDRTRRRARAVSPVEAVERGEAWLAQDPVVRRVQAAVAGSRPVALV